MSKRSGSEYRFSSRLAAPSIGITAEPAGIDIPASSVSRAATRVITSSGASQRTASSIAGGISDRSDRTASSCSGWESKPNSRFPVAR
jgi:hypothetical protein